ncbi:uncharacterized protein PHACADRAFT_211115 [Phanerochaete carnosa HHB-10118-sp]|uniref:Nab2 type CCCH zinc finger 4 domain-containing protein n=1 Tax=Phanerochaete carnosa (strain HHB-10118-sp) TaxID=650164 RepID=K5W2S0_PHACS|nr:uncharacterized protein PHACADRAFT_211115 [Phanerochaete carnosa HHB-10118-sp]EKM53415.1 hypothetical protein PHACADRAFT_211115 [Phanerochaete carnosa HHB-10118-sp]
MAFGLTIGTERATALQNAIQDELTKRGYSPDADPVMAEYITIMIINNKTPAQISSELEDLIGSEFDANFVDWLFAEVSKAAPEAESSTAPAPEPAPSAVPPPTHETPPHVQNELPRRPPNGPRAGPFQQAIAQALPSTLPSAQKRPASARSPSPSGHAHKTRRMDLPTGPRAMQRDGLSNMPSGSRSLLERMSSPRNGHFVKDDIQARIDNITAQNPEMAMLMGGAPQGFPMSGMPGMDMAAMQMTNPIMLQEMMMNQMALMTQMAGAMGILNPAAMNMNGFPMQPGMDMNMMGGMNGQQGMSGRGRGRGRGGMRGGHGGRGGHTPAPSSSMLDNAPPAPAMKAEQAPTVAAMPTPIIAAPTPVVAPQITPSTSQSRSGFVPPERPQSPTLCKFGVKCSNSVCRYSHPSPVATPESGVVLSNEPCENGKDCKDKDCVKSHVSPAVLKATGEQLNPKAPAFTPGAAQSPAPSHQSQIPCRFGAACTRPGCAFLHPNQKPANSVSQPCRFGTACTRATCPFQHPEGRVLPTTFHRGLSASGGLVTVSTPETGSMGAHSHNKSVTFNNPAKTGANGAASSAAELEKRVKEVEEKKAQALQAVAQAEAAAAAKKDDSKPPVPISA